LKGGSVDTRVGMKVMLYSYCSAFHVNPKDAYDTPASLIKEMLEIHGEVKKIESEEMKKATKGS
jgi:hypothetical protein|tara:strand:- start:55 stop:246 length:192 start_codon:yes stop_codon:yes gene_type:complete